MGKGKDVTRKVVINMWWIDIVVPILMALGVYCFLSLAGFRTRSLTRKTDRTAEDMYDNYADPPGKRHRRS
jgi:hypothetical protein